MILGVLSSLSGLAAGSGAVVRCSCRAGFLELLSGVEGGMNNARGLSSQANGFWNPRHLVWVGREAGVGLAPLLTSRPDGGALGCSGGLSPGLSSSNWCPYQESRLVTFVAACKTEKFLVHSQQPCPQGAPDCQRVRVM